MISKENLSAAPNQASWVTLLEESIILFLIQLLERGGQISSGSEAPPSSLLLRDQRRLERLMSYLHESQAAPIGLEDMARAADLSPRGLHKLCERRLGVPPLTVLRDLRLDSARQQLVASPELSITGVALAHGFWHLGRFAGYYRERFGELPMHTVRKTLAAD